MAAVHPADSNLSAPAYDRMKHDRRVLSGEWSEADWLWEEIRQLNAVLLLKAARRG